MVDKIR